MKKIMTGLVVALVVFTGFFLMKGQSVKATGAIQLNGGVASLLDTGCRNSSKIVEAEAEKLNVALLAEEEVTEDSNLFMANVTKTLNVRVEPDASSKRVGKLYKDCGGVVLEKGETWSKIQSGNLVGWASNEFLLFGEDAKELARSVGVTMATVTAKSLRVRNEADTEAETLAILPNGTSLEVVGTEGDWIIVDYDGQDGYMLSEYVGIDFILDHGETLQEIKEREAEEFEAKRFIHHAEYATDEETLRFLAALIYCEAGGEPYEGQLAVGAVVMNRVRSEAYPDTIAEVIYASGQFSPVKSGKVDRVYQAKKYTDSCLKAAQEAINGYSNVGDLTHFRRADGRAGYIIGRHVFY